MQDMWMILFVFLSLTKYTLKSLKILSQILCLKSKAGLPHPDFYARYVDDIICIFKPHKSLEAILEILNKST